MLQYKIINHGQQALMFIPPGVLGTQYEQAVSGTGATASEAGDSALAFFYRLAPIEQVTVDDAEQLEGEVSQLDDEIKAEDNKLFHVSILWRVVKCL